LGIEDMGYGIGYPQLGCGGRIPDFIRITDGIGALCGAVRMNLLFAVMVGVVDILGD
jgi:hypothetical protein